MTPQVAILPGNRLHLHHGPIDLVIGAEGARDDAFDAARARFETVLTELCRELPLLRRPVGPPARGRIARRMIRAARPHADGITTPMVAVAGAVAQEILSAMTDAADLTRAYVNNGGDIALHLRGAASFTIAIAAPDGTSLGQVRLTRADGIGGIATSGRGGRSLSLGIADAVTVLAPTAAGADAAATVLGNAVNLPHHPAIARRPAHALKDDSDLADTPVVTRVGALTGPEVATALETGLDAARSLQQAGLIRGAALFLRGEVRATGITAFIPQRKDPASCLTS